MLTNLNFKNEIGFKMKMLRVKEVRRGQVHVRQV